MIKDLTVGEPRKVVWLFTLPMFLSVVFQQLYNIADSVIVGNFSANGEAALAAVGASYPVTMIFMAIAIGCNIGCSVEISRLFGAKEYRQMKTAVFTTVIACLVLASVLTVLGMIFSRLILTALHTPSDIFGDADQYLRIYIGGLVFLFLYNVVTGIFTSLGDSKTPLYLLIGSSLGNILLDWVFVAVCHWDVAGVAWATFLCQGVACVLALWILLKRLQKVVCEGQLELFSGEMLRRISRIAVPSILQQSFVSVGTIFIQRLINGYGSSVIAGYSAAIKINTFGVTCFGTVGNAISSFTAQNVGAGSYRRVKKGFHGGVAMGLSIGIPYGTFCVLCCASLIRLFMKEETTEALQTGMMFLRIISPFYTMLVLKLVADGVLRGCGKIREFMITTFSDLIIRVILAYLMSPALGTLGIWLSWPVGWTLGAGLSLWYYRKLMKQHGQETAHPVTQG